MNRDTATLWRLYRTEWCIVYVLAARDDGLAECERIFAERYAGRVRDSDARLVTEGKGLTRVDMIMLQLPTLKGEFKHHHLAGAFANSHGWTDNIMIVAKNSAADTTLRSYGVKMLPQQ